MRNLIVLSLLLCNAFVWGDVAPKEKEPVRKLPLSRLMSTIQNDTHDYGVTLHRVQIHGLCIELDDGSVWEVESLGPEAQGFREQKKPRDDFRFVEEAVSKWAPGDKLYFVQRAPEKEELLVYNPARKQIYDFKPFHPPIAPARTLTSLDQEKRIIVLSDGSKWSFKGEFAPEYEWENGDPILIALENPWTRKKGAPYVLINSCACRCDSTVKHIHPNRQPVWRTK